MGRVLILTSCDQCRFHKDKCLLSNREFPNECFVFPEWCELRTPKEFYEYCKEKEAKEGSLSNF